MYYVGVGMDGGVVDVHFLGGAGCLVQVLFSVLVRGSGGSGWGLVR